MIQAGQDKEKGIYVAKLLDGKVEGLSSWERRAVDKLKAAAAEVEAAERRLGEVRQAAERAEIAIVSARGKASALADLLWTEKEALGEPKPDDA